jgi:diphthamide biosynthesis protein 3
MSIYEEVEIEDMIYNEKDYSYTYQCPCGDTFRITLEELHDGEDIAKCPSCTLRIMVIYDTDDLPPLPTEEDNGSDCNSDDDNDDDGNMNNAIDSKIVDQVSSIKVSG